MAVESPAFAELIAATDVETQNIFDLFPYEEDNDPKRRTHIVRPPENKHIFKIGMSAQDIVDAARLAGLEVVALCGYRWVPKHNPEKFDVCDKCMEIAGQLMSSAGE